MSSNDWSTYTNPDEMLVHLESYSSSRKLRLFCCACTRRVWSRLEHREGSRVAVEAAEEFADGKLTGEELARYYEEAERALEQASIGEERNACRAAHWSAGSKMDALGIARSVGWAASYASPDGEAEERKVQLEILHDIFDALVDSVSVPSLWLTPSVVALASKMYETRNFDAMPKLTLALESVGCDDAKILNHCKGPNSHVRGCWVVDLIIGKS